MLIAVGLLIYGVGAFIQIAEEWQSRGLTDTSFRSLGCLVLGPGLISYSAFSNYSWFIGISSLLPTCLALYLFTLKAKDAIRTYVLKR